MRWEEELAQHYLVSLGLGQVVYEPEPNLPPDFLINGTVAVEVRRLNQNEITAGGPFKPGFGLSGDVQISSTLSSRPERIIAKR
jgi:hypothetical protein